MKTRMLKRLAVVMLLALLGAAAHADGPDLTCQADADCVVKNVGNCCGYYPRCVNKDALVDPEAVKRACDKSLSAGVCGFQEIESCLCVDGQCQAHSIDTGLKPIRLK